MHFLQVHGLGVEFKPGLMWGLIRGAKHGTKSYATPNLFGNYERVQDKVVVILFKILNSKWLWNVRF